MDLPGTRRLGLIGPRRTFSTSFFGVLALALVALGVTAAMAEIDKAHQELQGIQKEVLKAFA